MKNLMRPILCALTVLALTAAPLVRAAAQDAFVDKPVAVISVASVNKLLGNVNYLTKASGNEDMGNMVTFMAGALTQGLEKSKPIGVFVTLDGMDPKYVGFVPVTSLQQVFEALKQQVGDPEDVGDGVYEIAKDQPQSVFVKEQAGWAFFAPSKDVLANLPQDPAKSLGDLPDQYDLAARVFIQNIPEDLRRMAADQLQMGYEMAMEQQADDEQDPAQRELNARLARNSIKQLIEAINGADQVTLGWGVDEQGRSTFLDLSVTAVAGSQLARQMALIKDAKSDHAGFLMPGAAMTLNFAGETSPTDVRNLVDMLTSLRQRATDEIDKDDGLPDPQTKQKAKDVIGSLFDVVQATAEAGKMDGGAVLMLGENQVGFAAGGFVADGAKLDKAIRDLVDLAKNEPEFPEVTLDAGKHAGVSFHTMTVPVEDFEARKVVGDELNIAVGTGPSSAYVAFGRDPIGLLKSIIDSSGSQAGQSVPPMQLTVSLGPIVKFASSIEQNPVTDLMTTALEKAGGKDRILINAKSIDRGVTYRFQIEEGVLSAVGEAIKGAMEGGGGEPNFDGGF